MMKRFALLFCVIVAVVGSLFLPSWAIIGSVSSWFSWSTISLPALQAVFGWPFFIALLGCKFFMGSSASLLLFCFRRLPLVFSSVTLAQRSLLQYIIFPLFAIILFTTHSVGHQVWWYSLHWLVPIALYFAKDSLYVRALAASYVAHAVGSCVWLYTGQVTVEQWQLIAYLVPFERILFAAGMVISVHVFTYLRLVIIDAIRRVVPV